jgi:hypothetical protein
MTALSSRFPNSPDTFNSGSTSAPHVGQLQYWSGWDSFLLYFMIGLSLPRHRTCADNFQLSWRDLFFASAKILSLSNAELNSGFGSLYFLGSGREHQHQTMPLSTLIGCHKVDICTTKQAGEVSGAQCPTCFRGLGKLFQSGLYLCDLHVQLHF